RGPAHSASSDSSTASRAPFTSGRASPDSSSAGPSPAAAFPSDGGSRISIGSLSQRTGLGQPAGRLPGVLRDRLEVPIVMQQGEPGELRAGGDQQVDRAGAAVF